MNDSGKNTREIRINPIVPTESVLVATARGMRPKEAEERVERGEHFVAIKPFASRFEWEIHILPLKHQADFLKASRTELDDFARVLRRTMARLDKVVGGVQYNFFLHSLPHGREFDDCQESYHWHLEICPRTSIPTGFELGSGLFVSTVSPELAAESLRNADIDGD